MNSVKHTLEADLYRYTGDTGFVSFWKAFLLIPGFRFVYFLRKSRYWREQRLWPVHWVYRLFLNHYRIKYGFDIFDTTNIGKGLYLGHFGGVVINPLAQIGETVNIGQSVTIGKVNRGKKIGVPTIGNRVWIGAHAIIVGNITIGDESLIAPGAYVNFDVPEKSVVLGNPGVIVSNKGSEGYINHYLP